MSADRARREVEREHRWRTLKTAGGIEGRPSRADERQFAEDAAAKAEAERRQLEEHERIQRAERDAEIQSAAVHALNAVERLRALLRGDRRDVVQAIDHHARRLGAHLDQLRRS